MVVSATVALLLCDASKVFDAVTVQRVVLETEKKNQEFALMKVHLCWYKNDLKLYF